MWWRALGVGFVLLCVGVVGGYAVAQRGEDRPVRGTVLEPVPAVSPSIPTPPVVSTNPDPVTDPLAPAQTLEPTDLRITGHGPGVSVGVPPDWHESRLTPGNTWTFAPAGSPLNTYNLRVQVMLGQRLSTGVAKTSRLAALQSLVDEGNAQDLNITAETADSFQANYVDVGGYRRYTLERWLPDESGTAYIDIAVTGRLTDESGLEDLISRVAASAAELDALPSKGSPD